MAYWACVRSGALFFLIIFGRLFTKTKLRFKMTFG
jgi:hypothetical protein